MCSRPSWTKAGPDCSRDQAGGECEANYQQRIAAAPTSDKRCIADEGMQELAKAVSEQGLSVEEYTTILEVAQNDPDVLEKLKQRIRPSVSSRKSGVTAGSRPRSSLQDIELAMFKRRDAPRHR